MSVPASAAVGLCVLLVLVGVDNAPTVIPDCTTATLKTCPPGYAKTPCIHDKPTTPGCFPCPPGTFITDTSFTCSPRRTCDGLHMTYESRGDATSDAVCGCETSYSLSHNGKCVYDIKENQHRQRRGSNVTSDDTNDVTPVPTHAPQPPSWLGWVIVVTVTVSFKIVMLVFWFWTPCLRGEPDYGDGSRDIDFKTRPEMEKLVQRELTDAENELAVRYVVRRLPELLPAVHTQEVLSALFNTAWGTSQGQQALQELGAGETDVGRLEQGLTVWENHPGETAQFSHLVEAMLSTGNRQRATQLTQEVHVHLQQRHTEG